MCVCVCVSVCVCVCVCVYSKTVWFQNCTDIENNCLESQLYMYLRVLHVLQGSCTILYEHKYLNTNKTYVGTKENVCFLV